MDPFWSEPVLAIEDMAATWEDGALLDGETATRELSQQLHHLEHLRQMAHGVLEARDRDWREVRADAASARADALSAKQLASQTQEDMNLMSKKLENLEQWAVNQLCPDVQDFVKMMGQEVMERDPVRELIGDLVSGIRSMYLRDMPDEGVLILDEINCQLALLWEQLRASAADSILSHSESIENFNRYTNSQLAWDFLSLSSGFPGAVTEQDIINDPSLITRVHKRNSSIERVMYSRFHLRQVECADSLKGLMAVTEASYGSLQNLVDQLEALVPVRPEAGLLDAMDMDDRQPVAAGGLAVGGGGGVVAAGATSGSYVVLLMRVCSSFSSEVAHASWKHSSGTCILEV